MRLMTLKQYMKMSKPALIRKITKTLTAMPKVKLARICYNITKSKLPRLTTAVAGFPIRMPIRQKALPKRKTKRKTKKIVGETYHTKNGQPYKILASGKARFLKR